MATACSFLNTPHRKLLAWALGYALFRLITSAFVPVPFAVPLDPLAICAAGMITVGDRHNLPGALVLTLAGLLAGDLAAGLGAASILPRVLGILLLLFVLPRKIDALSTALFLIVTHAVWSSLGPEFRGEFPFVYLYALFVIQGLLFLGLLLPLLPDTPFRPGVFATGIILLIPASVLLICFTLQPLPLWPPPSLGQSGDTLLRTAATLLILPPFIPSLIQGAKRFKRPSPAGSRQNHTEADPPDTSGQTRL
jgi:hypothetical protein